MGYVGHEVSSSRPLSCKQYTERYPILQVRMRRRAQGLRLSGLIRFTTDSLNKEKTNGQAIRRTLEIPCGRRAATGGAAQVRTRAGRRAAGMPWHRSKPANIRAEQLYLPQLSVQSPLR